MLDEKKLIEVMAIVLDVDTSAITPESSMDTLKNWDSLRHMNLVLAIEDEFKVAIPDEDAANITSYAIIRHVLEELLRQK